jgi:hypothetical protein
VLWRDIFWKSAVLALLVHRLARGSRASAAAKTEKTACVVPESCGT